MTGWKLDNFRRNPIVLWAHCSDQPPIGKVISILARAGQLLARVKFASDVYEFAATIERLVQGGFIQATSVGFQPLKWAFNEERGGFDFQEQELLELSVVPVPCNPQALLQAKQAGIDMSPIREWAEKALAWVAPPAPVEEKAGRVLSRANESALRSARDGAAAACQHLDAVLAACGDDDMDEMEEPEKGLPAPTTTAETAAPEYVVRLAPSKPASPQALDLASVDAAIVRGVSIAVQRAISRALGRLED